MARTTATARGMKDQSRNARSSAARRHRAVGAAERRGEWDRAQLRRASEGEEGEKGRGRPDGDGGGGRRAVADVVRRAPRRRRAPTPPQTTADGARTATGGADPAQIQEGVIRRTAGATYLFHHCSSCAARPDQRTLGADRQRHQRRRRARRHRSRRSLALRLDADAVGVVHPLRRRSPACACRCRRRLTPPRIVIAPTTVRWQSALKQLHIRCEDASIERARRAAGAAAAGAAVLAAPRHRRRRSGDREAPRRARRPRLAAPHLRRGRRPPAERQGRIPLHRRRPRPRRPPPDPLSVGGGGGLPVHPQGRGGRARSRGADRAVGGGGDGADRSVRSPTARAIGGCCRS